MLGGPCTPVVSWLRVGSPATVQPVPSRTPALRPTFRPVTLVDVRPPPPVPAPPRARRRARPDRVALGLLLAGTTALYTVALPRSGWGNAFYAGAAQAGAASWRAWFYGASDAPGSITVDKPPAALWVMGLSVRLFGLSSWSLLVPEALMGVAAVAVLAATVRRLSLIHI